ncbi:ficolin-1 [Plakobranchus ocellatus]|uniref:Ficolin-1 n=1 Tax=Plakobranchus ocellatus TaxID=259542 RepID=A0AAV4CZ91_9GAST|nr:ficolin-1 [Plakobranchus ocellatus]
MLCAPGCCCPCDFSPHQSCQGEQYQVSSPSGRKFRDRKKVSLQEIRFNSVLRFTNSRELDAVEQIVEKSEYQNIVKMEKLLLLLCLTCIISGINSLQFSLDRNVSTLISRRQACGILTCKESNPHHSENTITRMSVFKKQQSGPIASDTPGLGNLMASVTLNQPLIARESDGVNINGRLEAGKASLRLELFTKEDCSAEYTCEVRMLDSQEKESINTYHLLQHYDSTANEESGYMATLAGSFHALLLFQQLAMLDSKLGSVENRLEDKIASLRDDIESKIEKPIMDKLRQMENSLSPVDDAVNANSKGLEDFERNLATFRREDQQAALTDVLATAENIDDRLNSTSIEVSSIYRLLTELLTWQQTGQNECKNLTLAAQKVLNSNEGLVSNMSENFAQLYNELQGDYKQLKSDVRNMSTGIHYSIDNVLSKTNIRISERLSSMDEFFRHNSCRKGMINVMSHAPFPYPVIFPSSQTSFSFPYLCDTITDGGGWIVIQRRTTGKVNFYRDWAAYKKGFGSLADDFWLGNDNIHTITSSGTYELRVDLKYQGKSAFAHYSTFSIDDEDNSYAIQLGDYDGTAGDSMDRHRGRPFSTFNRDNDAHSGGNCANTHLGAWWYNKCHASNLNGKWMAINDKGPRWGKFSGSNPVSYSEMKIRKL